MDELYVRSLLVNVSPSPVDDRVYQDILPPTLPQPVTLPYIVYSVVSETPENVLADAPAVSNFRVQLDLYAERAIDLPAMRAAVRAALNAHGVEALSLGGYDDDTRLHRYTMDWSLWLPR